MAVFLLEEIPKDSGTVVNGHAIWPQSIDVIRFNTEIRGAPLTLKRARHLIEVTGRGSTSFNTAIAFLDQHRDYGGAIIFADGIARFFPGPRTATRVCSRSSRANRPTRGSTWLSNRWIVPPT